MPQKQTDIGARMLPPPEGGVTIRMYNAGFGDCFLLAFRGNDDEARYVLIDCGVYQTYPKGSERMKRVARDIAAATDSTLHIVAVTHEHLDHIDGFVLAEPEFSTFRICELYLAWTEDKNNAAANKLRGIRELRIRALRSALDQMNAAGSPLSDGIKQIMDFEIPDMPLLGMRSTGEIMETLRGWSEKKPERPEDFRTPNEPPLSIKDVRGVRCFVLGPPADEKYIKKLRDPKEMYFNGMPADEEAAFMAAVLEEEEISDAGTERQPRSYPFDKKYSLTQKQASTGTYREFFNNHYGFGNGEKSAPPWRRIDTDWLASAEQLAINIGDETNNTSLVLAFELTQSSPAKVLFFVGDAQVGNWLSWQGMKWPAEAGEKEVSAAELLRRTVLYKVGHHGSLNATLSTRGLEKMESPDLVAMIPVDEKWARAKSKPWDHPDKNVRARLMAKTRGRVLRSDEIPKGTKLEKPDEADDRTWDEFVKNIEWDSGEDPLWIQYTIR